MGKSMEHDGGEGATALAEAPQKSAVKPKELPPYKVLLHNDDVNEMLYVIVAILELTPLKKQAAVKVMFEAHSKGVSLLLTTHKERAELYQEQFQSKKLKVSIEPVEGE